MPSDIPDTELVRIDAAAPIQMDRPAEQQSVVGFSAVIYNGGALELNGWEMPVVVDLAGVTNRRNMVAHLDHDRTQRVGQFDAHNDGRQLIAEGTTSAASEARDQVVQSARDGYVWEASVEMRPDHRQVEQIPPGQQVTVNGRTFSGPLLVARATELRGFSFVSHGADSETVVNIAAEAAQQKETETMTKTADLDKDFLAWAEDQLPGTDIAAMAPASLEKLQANYAGRDNPPAPRSTTPAAASFNEKIDAKAAEMKRQEDIEKYALLAIEKSPGQIQAIKDIAASAITDGTTVDKFRLSLFEIAVPRDNTVQANADPGQGRFSEKVLEAAVCQAGNLQDIEKHYDDRTLQTAHDQFRRGIGLKQLFIVAAQQNGHHAHSFDIDAEVMEAAWKPPKRGNNGRRIDIDAAGFSPVSLQTMLGNIANKFLMRGWMSIDQTALRLASRKSASNFHEMTTTSLIGDVEFREVGADGQLQHGNAGEVTYSNRVRTQGILFTLTRTDQINDDLNALTDQPRRIGRGGMLRLNKIFWKEFLDNAAFFTTGNGNLLEGGGGTDATLGDTGLKLAEALFMKQTDPDGNPLGVQPAILLVPTDLRADGSTLMTSQLVVSGESKRQGDRNIWNGRFQLESSPYMHNQQFTGWSSAAWYLLADPEDLPTIEIAALGGRIEPTVETTTADFDTLGVKMRGYADYGARKQEYRAAVRSDGVAAA